MNGEKKHPPLSEEIELTLLGPGFGESIVIHIGDNKWIIVDSCINNNISSCAPLDYLTQIGVDFSNVVLIVATHWHDDHVKKMSDVVQACTNAKFCCSSALKSDEFMAYVTRHNEVTDTKWTSGVVELNNIFEILSERKKPTPIHAVNNKRILQKTLSNSNICEVWTLSPSDKDIENFIKDIRNLIPIENDPQKTATTPKRNTSSVVIHIKIGNEVLLLGSDLEETKDDSTGWGVIVASEEKPEGKAKIFKVPHHGSITGHSDQVWQHLIDDQNPFAVLTPYNRGHKLPKSEDAQRICSFTDNAYSTINLHVNKTVKRPSNVEKKIAQTVGSIRSISTKVGMLRLRKNMTLPLAEWDLKTFDGGCHLSEVWKST
jgi:beta-lactamase superfamily II metal-dependent hydrolase